jgi:two-component system chemotaxis response regulator CheB
VTLDVQMPGLDGLATLGYIMSEAARPVVMLSALADGGETTMRALELGAVDFVRKPALGDSLDLSTLRGRLLGALRTAAGSRCTSVPALARAPVRARAAGAAIDERPSHLVVIAASTGGPRALAEIVPMLEPSTAAIVVVQHMPPGFTLSLARRLDALSALRVDEAVDGEPLRARRVYVAPGGLHTTIDAQAGALRLAVRPGLPVHGVAPAADPTLLSAAPVFGARCIAVVLTGMGHDGAHGACAVREGGGFVIVQDERTSIVYGMPQAALSAAGADAIAPLHRVAEVIAIGLRARGVATPMAGLCA